MLIVLEILLFTNHILLIPLIQDRNLVILFWEWESEKVNTISEFLTNFPVKDKIKLIQCRSKKVKM